MSISICRDGVEIGQWSEDDIRQFYKTGRLTHTDYYWTVGMEEWRPLPQFIGLCPPIPRAVTQILPGHKSEVNHGGLNRIQFFGAYIFMLLALFFLEVVFGPTSKSELWWAISLVGTTVLLALRLQNIGYSPGYAMLGLVPCIGFIIAAICLFVPPGYADIERVRKLEKSKSKTA